MAAEAGGLDFDTSALEYQNDFFDSLTDLNGVNVLSEEFLDKQSALLVQDKKEKNDLVHTILKDGDEGKHTNPSYEMLLHSILEKPDQQVVKQTRQSKSSIEIGPYIAGTLLIIAFASYVAIIEKRRKRKARTYDYVDDIS